MLLLLLRALLAVRLRAPPPTPERLRDLAELHRRAFPEADAERWEAFCAQLAGAAYWEGERRGYARGRGASRAELRVEHDWTRPRLPGDLPAYGAPNPGGTPEEVERLRQLVEAARAAGCEVTVRRVGEGEHHG